jgi:hypothetical protein
LTGPRKEISLLIAPFRLSVPAGWKMQPIGSSEVLRGVTPTGAIEMTIAFRNTLTSDGKQQLIDAYKAQGPKEGYRRVTTRSSNGFEVLDLQRTEHPISEPSLDDQGRKISDTSTPLTWTLLAFVADPDLQGRFDEYELSFVSLDDELYQPDKDFLESVLNTLRYDPNKTSGGT